MSDAPSGTGRNSNPRRRTRCAKSTSIRCWSLSCGSTSGRVDEHASSKRATARRFQRAISRNRMFHPLLAKLGIPKAGLHAFRHSRVTLLRKNGAPADLQRQWIGHWSLKTTDRYSHTDQELEYRRKAASRVGLDLIVGPNEHAAALAAVAVNVIGTFQATGKATLGVREVSVAVGTRIENVPVRRWPHWIRRGPKRQHAMSTSAIKVCTRRGPNEGRKIRKSGAFSCESHQTLTHSSAAR